MIETNKMNVLIIQLGNTSIKWGFFCGNKLHSHGKSFDFNSNELQEIYSKNENVYFSCEASEQVKTKFTLAFPNAKEIPDSLYPTHLYKEGKPGYDRLANVAAASDLFPSEVCLIVDFGTCITYTICENSQFIQGAITPGVHLRYKAMNEGTGKLPLIQNELDFSKKFGQNTNENLIAGVSVGIFNEIKGFIELAQSNYNNPRILFTGSNAAFFEKHAHYPIFVEENLTLIGLRKIIS
jgi:type III pantothenate kinase